jgi:FAD:protein FMN transferase
MKFDVQVDQLISDPELIHSVIVPVTGTYYTYPHAERDLNRLRETLARFQNKPIDAKKAETLVLRGATMGTTYSIKFVAAAGTVDVEGLHAAIQAELAEIDRQMSTYRPDSELSRFNRAPAGEWFAVSPAVAEVVAEAHKISAKSGGAMDVTVGPLVRLWHFGPATDARRRGTGELKLPTNEAVAAARDTTGYRKLEVRLDPPALRKEIDGLEVDLNSIAPGFAIDRLAAILWDAGIGDFMVEIGGEVRAGGLRADRQPWRVAIERPSGGAREIYEAIPLVDAAVATAGDYQQFFEHEGRRYSHIINPATGRPIEHSLASVTVVADTCIEADGWDTSLLVLGIERGLECAEQHGVAALFIQRGNGGDEVRATRAWRERVGASGKSDSP